MLWEITLERHEEEHFSQPKGCVGQEVDEVLPIVVAHTVADPRAMICMKDEIRSIWRMH